MQMSKESLNHHQRFVSHRGFNSRLELPPEHQCLGGSKNKRIEYIPGISPAKNILMSFWKSINNFLNFLDSTLNCQIRLVKGSQEAHSFADSFGMVDNHLLRRTAVH